MKEKKRKACVIIKGVVYESSRAVREHFNMTRSAVYFRVTSHLYKDWNYGTTKDKIDIYELPRPKKVISEDNKLKLIKANTGRKMPEHVRQILIKVNTGRKQSEKQKEAVRRATSTDEFRAKIKLTRIKFNLNIRILIDNVCFPSLLHAQKYMNMTNTSIKRRCLSDSSKYNNWQIIQHDNRVI